MELSSQNGNEAVYIIYSDGIKVTGFDRVYKFVLTNGSQQQTLYYSINAYCNAKWGSATDKVKNLARTLYYYGIAAEAYQASLLNS